MADIYLSHSTWDRARIVPIIALLEREGWSVWHAARAHADEISDDARDETADSEARVAACIIVAWSISALDSEPVRDEARAGFERGVLVPVLVEQVAPPHLFSAIPAVDVTTWKGDPAAPEARALVEAVRRTAGVPGLWAAAQAARGAPEIDRWESVQGSRDPADFENFLSLHPKGPLAEPARARLEQLQLYDQARTQPARTRGSASLWLLAAVLVAMAGASTWYSFDPRVVQSLIGMQSGSDDPSAASAPDIPPVTAEPEVPPEPALAPQAEVAPSANPPADVYRPFGDKTRGCPAEEFACKSTPGCTWWAAFNICVAQEPAAGAQAPEEQTQAPPASTIPQCPTDENTCRMITECEWVEHFKSCLPRPPPVTTEAPSEAPHDVPQCSSFADAVSCAEAGCDWIIDQCFEKPLAPE